MASTYMRDSPLRDEFVDDFDSLGVINALERTCELESKLRQAIQQTHPLTTTLDWDFDIADREREALLAIRYVADFTRNLVLEMRKYFNSWPLIFIFISIFACSEQLEYLEDKLREYRFLDQANTDQRAVLLGQLDNVRKELLEVVSANYPRVVFGKEIAREIFNFACAGEDTPRTVATLASSPSRPPKRTPSKDRDISKGSDRSYYPSPGADSSLFSIMSSPKRPLPVAQHNAYPSTYDNDLWVENGQGQGQGQPNTRSNDKLAVPVPGSTTNIPATRTTTRSGIRSSPNGGGRSVTPDVGIDRDRSRRYGASSASSHHHNITDEDIYGPSEPPSRRLTAHATASPSSNATAVGPIGTTSGDYGGMLKIREMLSRAEEGLTAVNEAQVQRRTPPRILGGGIPEHGASVGPPEDWDGIGNTHNGAGVGLGGGHPAVSNGYLTPRDGDDVGSLWGGQSDHRRSPIQPSNYIREWTTRSEAGHHYHTPGAPPSEAPSSKLGAAFTGIMGRLAGLVFVLGGIAVASMVAAKPDAPPPGPSIRSTEGGRRRSSGGRREEGSSGSAGRGTTPSTAAAATNNRRGSPNSSGPADMPPWLTEADSGTTTPSAATNTGSRVNQGGQGGRRKATSGRGGAPKSISNKSKGGGSYSPTQSPVMHVHNPPLTDSFPSNPPDVTAAMG